MAAAMIRPATTDDAEALGPLAPLLGRKDAEVVIDHAGRSAALDPTGTALNPNHLCLRLGPRADAEAAESLIDHLLNSVREGAVERLLAVCDPMDHRMIKMFESRGFQPTGVPPYFELGGTEVEYVSGYRDATGSCLELARSV